MAGLLKSMPPRASKQTDASILAKTKKTQTVNGAVKGGNSLLDRIQMMMSVVSTKLGKYADKYVLLRTEEEVAKYFQAIIDNGIGAIDTETDSLDPMVCNIAGVCIYTPGQKPAYIPLHHVSYITGIEVEGQVSTQFICDWLRVCEELEIKWIMHTAKFDIRVILNTIGIKISCYWDCLLAAKCLNENESHALKDLHLKYCVSQDTESLKYDTLFSGIPFTKVPITTGYLYAAGDGVKTFDVYEYQKLYLTRRMTPGLYTIFTQIEMPLIAAVADMEETGITLSIPFAKKLSEKYNAILVEREENFYKTLSMYQEEIDAYKRRVPNHKLSDPVSIGSPTQLAVILYDILKLTSPIKDKPRGTGEDILELLDVPLSRVILEWRQTSKLLTTYIDKMPEVVNKKTGRVHCNFNQMGAGTGRFSSTDPNMQNIPSKNHEIRQMFTAGKDKVLISGDFSQQEPRTLAHMSGDAHLIQAYIDDKDIYAWIASSIYKVPYDECREKRLDGTASKEGKKRRDSVKSIILGIMYGRGAKAIGEQIGKSTKEAQKIVDKFFTEYPSVKDFIDSTIANAKIDGFVTTAWGRKRRLPDMVLEEFEFEYVGAKSVNFDPLAFDEPVQQDVTQAQREFYSTKLRKTYSGKERANIRTQALQQGVKIRDNGGFIAEASRQCVNSIIQGTSADMIKLAMILIYNDARLTELGFKMLLQVHDELIAECPEENAKECGDRMAQLMVQAATSKIKVPMKVDITVSREWYGEEEDVA